MNTITVWLLLNLFNSGGLMATNTIAQFSSLEDCNKAISNIKIYSQRELPFIGICVEAKVIK